MNEWIVAGNLTQDAELCYTKDGLPILNGCIACNEYYGSKDDTGKTRKYTEFVHFVMFGELAEKSTPRFQKGLLLGVRGRAHTEKWEKDGHNHYRTKLVVEKIEYLHSANGENKEAKSRGSLHDRFAPPEDDIATPEEDKPPLDNTDDDLPF